MLKVGDKVTCVKPNHTRILRDSDGEIDTTKVFEIIRSWKEDNSPELVDILEPATGKKEYGFFADRFERVPEELTSKFKVGDKLVIVKNTTGGFRVGTEVTVDAVLREDDGSVRAYKVAGEMPSGNISTMYHPENNLDYAPVAPPVVVAKFKVGDAVKVVKNSLNGHSVGTLAVVAKVRKRDASSFYYDLKSSYEYPMRHLECDIELQEVVFEIGDTVEIVNNTSGGYSEGTIARIIRNMDEDKYYLLQATEKGKTMWLLQAHNFKLISKGNGIINESEWTFEVTNKAQVDYGMVAAELTRKNPVAIVDDPENEEVIFLVSAFFQDKLEELGTPFFDDCEVTHRDLFSLFFVPRKSAEAFTKLLVEAGKAKYPREARRRVQVVLPKMK